MEEKKINKETVCKCGFVVRKSYEGQKDFDVNYKDIKIVKKVVALADGQYSIVEEEVITEIPIVETIQSQACDVGIDAFMRPYELAGTGLPDVKISDDIQDFTKLPENPADVAKVGDAAMRAFLSLDPALRGDAKSPEEFLANMTQAKFDAYIASKVKKPEEIKEEK